MIEDRFEVSGRAHVHLTRCSDDLVVRAGLAGQVVIRCGDPESLEINRDGDTFTVRAHSNCSVICPPDTQVSIDVVDGNLSVEALAGRVEVTSVSGNLKLGHANEFSAGQVNGNVRAQQLDGPFVLERGRGNVKIYRAAGGLSLGNIDGNLLVRDAAADVCVDSVGGNVKVYRVQGALTLGRVAGSLLVLDSADDVLTEWVGGNVSLDPGSVLAQSIAVQAGGNVKIGLSEDVSLRARLQAGGGVRSHVAGAAITEEDGLTTVLLGSGAAELTVEAGGYVSLFPREISAGMGVFPAPDMFDDLDEVRIEIESRVAETLAAFGSRLDDKLAGIDDLEIRERVRDVDERVMGATRAAYEKARRQAERDAERARLRAERAERRWQRVSSKGQPRSKTQATDEERLRVLWLVEAGKIAPDQAIDLLAALEGR